MLGRVYIDARPSVRNSFSAVSPTCGQSKGFCPAIVERIASSSVCICCTCGKKEVLSQGNDRSLV